MTLTYGRREVKALLPKKVKKRKTLLLKYALAQDAFTKYEAFPFALKTLAEDERIAFVEALLLKAPSLVFESEPIKFFDPQDDPQVVDSKPWIESERLEKQRRDLKRGAYPSLSARCALWKPKTSSVARPSAINLALSPAS
jgi:hypothetical protein